MHRTLISHALRRNCSVLAVRPYLSLRYYRFRPFKRKGPLALRRPDHGLKQSSEYVAEQQGILKSNDKEAEVLTVTESGDTCLGPAAKSTAPEGTVTGPRKFSSPDKTLSPSARESRTNSTLGESDKADSFKTDPVKYIVQNKADGDECDLITEVKLKRLDAKPKQYRPYLREAQRIGTVIGYGNGGPIKRVDRKLLTTQILQDELRWIAKTTPQPKLTLEILNILIGDRKIKPRPDHYEPLILSNCSPEFGSAGNVKTILEEMEREGIVISPSVYYAALTALTVHPDTYLRTTILQRLAQQWVTLPPLYAQLNIVALIREGQLELATIELENLEQDGTYINTWVWTIYMHALCDQYAFEDLLQLCYKLYDSNFPFQRHTLLHILLIASRRAVRRDDDAGASVAKWIWSTYVETMHIIPDKSICINVLTIAHRTKDVDMAESVAVVLGNAGAVETTTPPNLAPWEKENELTYTLHSPDLLGWNSSSSSSTAASSTEREQQEQHVEVNEDDTGGTFDEEKAAAFSTPLDLPSQLLPPRQIPGQANSLLQRIRQSANARRRSEVGVLPSVPRRKNPAVVYKFFREESGLRGARFDPILALKEGWNWRKK